MTPSPAQHRKPIPERLQAQLLALGIPAGKHGREDLAEYFPKEFNIGATTLDAADMGRVLLHLTASNLISVSPSGVPTSIKTVQPGWHFCQFYRDTAQLVQMIAPYMAEGLKNGEGCLWVMPETITRQAACDAVGQHIDGVDDYIARGQLEILYYRDWYLDASGRLKSFEEIATALLARQDAALAKGYKFLRAAGDTGWISGTEQSKAFLDYENKVNAAIGKTKVAAVCTYRADVTADEFVAIVNAHQDAFYRPPGPPECVSVR